MSPWRCPQEGLWSVPEKGFRGKALGVRGSGVLVGRGGVLTVQVALANPGCILSVDKLVAAAAH